MQKILKSLDIALNNKINYEVHKIDANHDVMLSHPKELANLLETIAKKNY